MAHSQGGAHRREEGSVALQLGLFQDRLRVAVGFRQSERSKRERLGASCPYNDLASQAAAQRQLGRGPFAGSESLSLNARGGQPGSTLERSVKEFVDAR